LGFVSGKGTSTEINSYNFTDKNLAPGVYTYRLKQTDFDGTSRYHKLTQNVEVSVPEKFEVMQNYPNPFNPSTKISFSIPSDQIVSVKIYNSLGEETAVLVNNILKAGFYEYEFNAKGLSSGVYYYEVKWGNSSATRKMMVLK
jgi:hypothetical protein